MSTALLNRLKTKGSSGAPWLLREASAGKGLVVHPFLFAMFPILALYASNLKNVRFSEVVAPLGVALGSALALFLLSLLVLRDANKSGIVASTSAVLFLSFGHVSRVVTWYTPWLQRVLPILWAAIFIIALFLTVRSRWNLRNLTIVMNIMATCMVLFSLIRIGAYEIKHLGSSAEQQMPEMTLELTKPDSTPDIYYIILDSYPSSNHLAEAYDYDNGVFTNYLSERGFYVASESCSNYCWTQLSLASSLNMDYLSTIALEEVGATPKQLVEDNRVVKALKHVGYQYVHFNTWNDPTMSSSEADLAVDVSGTSLSPFQRMLVQDSLASLVWHDAVNYREHVLKAFDELADMPAVKGPKFVFAHIMFPHPPFVFDSEGHRIDPPDWTQDVHYKQRFLDTISFLNKKIEVMVSQILSVSTTPPIIILQGDHGIRFADWPKVIGSHNPTEEEARDSHMILNALYLPRGGDSLMYESVSPVNTFRAVFNFYFGTDLPFLPDESYFCGWGGGSLVDVTDRL